MPQMSPMNWTILYIMFLVSILFTMEKISYIKNFKIKSLLKHSTENYSSNWLW